jgi:secreted PhoX family phosphatase
MDLSRRGFLKGSAAATAGLVTVPLATEMLNEQKREAVGHDIAAMFNALPGDKAENCGTISKWQKQDTRAVER